MIRISTSWFETCSESQQADLGPCRFENLRRVPCQPFPPCEWEGAGACRMNYGYHHSFDSVLALGSDQEIRNNHRRGKEGMAHSTVLVLCAPLRYGLVHSGWGYPHRVSHCHNGFLLDTPLRLHGAAMHTTTFEAKSDSAPRP